MMRGFFYQCAIEHHLKTMKQWKSLLANEWNKPTFAKLGGTERGKRRTQSDRGDEVVPPRRGSKEKGKERHLDEHRTNRRT
jgi:hypothetical protein